MSFHHSSHLLGYSFHIWDHKWVSLVKFDQVRGIKLRWSQWECLALPDSALVPGDPLPPHLLLADPVETFLPLPATNSGSRSSLLDVSLLLSILGVTHDSLSSAQQDAYHPSRAPEGGCY